MKHMGRSLMFALVFVLAMTSLHGVVLGAKKYVVKFAHGSEITEPTHEAALLMAERVAERTNGQVEIQVFPSNQLGSERDIFEACKLNAIQMIFESPGSIGVFQPEVEIFNGPFLWKDWEETKRVMRGPFGQELYAKVLQNHGLRVLDPNWYWGWRHLTTRNTPVRVPEDVKGLKVRSPNILIFMETLKAMGASPTPVDFGEVYTALQQGLVDGQENPIPTIWAKRFFEVQKYVVLTGHMLQSNHILINDRFFQSMPKEFQAILQEEVLAAGEYMRTLQQQEEEELIAKIEAQGVTIIRDVDRETFRKITEGVYEKFEDNWGRGLYQKLRQAILDAQE